MFKKMIVTVLVLVMVGSFGLFAQSPNLNEGKGEFASPPAGGYMATEEQWWASTDESGKLNIEPIPQDKTISVKIAIPFKTPSGEGIALLAFDTDGDGEIGDESVNRFDFKESPENRQKGIYWTREYWNQNDELSTEVYYMYHDVDNDMYYVIIHGDSEEKFIIRLGYIGEL